MNVGGALLCLTFRRQSRWLHHVQSEQVSYENLMSKAEISGCQFHGVAKLSQLEIRVFMLMIMLAAARVLISFAKAKTEQAGDYLMLFDADNAIISVYWRSDIVPRGRISMSDH